MAIRGQIRNDDFARQQIDYSGLRWGKITPTDNDGMGGAGEIIRLRGFLDFGNRLFVFMEFKYKKAEMSPGQKLAFERLVNRVSIPGYYLLCNHNYSPEQNIIAHLTQVYSVWSNREGFGHEWRNIEIDINLKEYIDGLRIYWGIK